MLSMFLLIHSLSPVTRNLTEVADLQGSEEIGGGMCEWMPSCQGPTETVHCSQRTRWSHPCLGTAYDGALLPQLGLGRADRLPRVPAAAAMLKRQKAANDAQASQKTKQ